MKFRVIKAYLKKEIIDLVRSKMIIFTYLMPVMVLLLFGSGIKMEIEHSRVVIIDYDKSELSKSLLQDFRHSKYFNVVKSDITENEVMRLFRKAKIDIVVIIPNDFQKRLYKNQKTDIAIFVDGAFPIRAITMENYTKGVVFNAITKKTDLKPAIKINIRNIFNQSLRDEDAIVPGIIGLALLIAPAILIALSIVKEKEIGTIFNFYSSPITKLEFIIVKLIPPFVLHSFTGILLFLIAIYYFDTSFKGSFLLYLIATELFIFASLGIGLLVSIITKKQITALLVTIIITIIPGFLYSGILMPISSMNSESYIEAHFFPIMYYNHIVYDSFLIGEGFNSFINIEYLWILLFYGLFLNFIGFLLLRKGN